MSNKTVAFVAFQDQPNLGIGYMTGVLAEEGFSVEVIDMGMGSEGILERIRSLDPLVVGLSVIFQYYTPRFAALVRFLRDHGITCMICAGGHYPSLKFEEALRAMPGLDCVVRFEGEYTLLAIARRLQEGRDWKDVRSIAFQENGTTVFTALRPLVENLDDLPFPDRWTSGYHCLGVRATSLLASRGCPRNCSFCCIRRFYAIPPGSIRRVRSPENVVREMLDLYLNHGMRIFLFQDDDFPLISKSDRRWARQFVNYLQGSEMSGSIMWKISCRADEVEPEIFALFRSAGLYLVYIGIESGNETGLEVLNKQIDVQQNLAAVTTLKDLGLRYDFGYMLFDPSSTVDLVLQNVGFLRQICGDGSATASFGKTLPYSGTDLEQRMDEEGRLRGDVCSPDYSFLDRQTEDWFAYLCSVFEPWVSGRDSLQAQLRWALFEADVLGRFYADTPGLKDHRKRLRFLTHWYNEIFCRILEDSAKFLGPPVERSAWQSIRSAAEQQRLWLEDQLAGQRRSFFTESDFPIALVVGETNRGSA